MRCLTRVACAAVLLLSLLAGSGCETLSGTAHNPRIPEPASAAVLRAGDSLTISVQGVPDPTVLAQQIDEQGLVTLPYIGAVPASGATAAQLSQRVRETYVARKIYNAVDVTVSVTERYVYVGGEVANQGRIAWSPDLTLSKAVQAAGGFTVYAKESGVSLVRDQHAYVVNATLAQRSPAEDPRLFPGDSLQVPRSAF